MTEHFCNFACPEHCGEHHKSPIQRALHAVAAYKVRGRGRPSAETTADDVFSKKQICEAAGINSTLYDRAQAIHAHPELYAAALEDDTKFVSLWKKATDLTRQQKLAQVEWTPEYREGRFQDVLTDIADNTVDAVVCDVPWGEKLYEMDGLYDDLGAFCARVLKPGGLAALLVGQSALLDLIDGVRPHLSYVWHVSYQQPTGKNDAVQVFGRHYPVLVWQNGSGPVDLHGKADVIDGGRLLSEDKTHRYEKTPEGMTALLDLVSAPGDLIVDPCAGSDATGRAARGSGRRCISATLDPFL